MPKRGKSIRSSSRNEETKPSKSTAKTTDRFISISFKHFHNVDDVGQSIIHGKMMVAYLISLKNWFI